MFVVLVFVPVLASYSGVGGVPSGDGGSGDGSSGVDSSPMFLGPSTIAGTRLRGACGSFAGLVGSLGTRGVRGVRVDSSFPRLMPYAAARGRVVSR